MGTRVQMATTIDKALAGLPQLLEDLQKLSEDQESCDVVFLLGIEEVRVFGHKIILMARYYKIIFNVHS